MKNKYHNLVNQFVNNHPEVQEALQVLRDKNLRADCAGKKRAKRHISSLRAFAYDAIKDGQEDLLI